MFKTWVVILSVFLVAAFAGNTHRAIDKIQEARIAETSREMVTSGDWVVPHYNGTLRLQKPPLTYWTTACSYVVFGISEIATRVPSILFALATMVLIWRWLSKHLDPDTASTAVLIIASCFLGLRYLRSGEADATLMFFITLAAYGGFELCVQRLGRSWPVWLWYVGMGLGFFAKGPAGIAIPLLSLSGYALLNRQRATLMQGLHGPAFLVFLLIAFAWYVWIWLTLPDAANHFFQKQVDETFVSGTHRQPVYWYLLHAFEFFSPWSVFILPMGIWLYRSSQRPAVIRFALVWLMVVLVLLTVTVNKQTQYALLFLPPLSMLMADYLVRASEGFQRFNRYFLWLVLLALPLTVGVLAYKHGWALAAQTPAIGLLLVPIILHRMLKPTALRLDVVLFACASVFLFLWVAQYQATKEDSNDIKGLMQIARHIRPLYQADTVGGHGAVSFYAGRVVPPLSEQAMPVALNELHTLWWLSKEAPRITQATVTAEQRVGKWTLWKIVKPATQP